MIGAGVQLHRIPITGLTTNADNAVGSPGAAQYPYIYSGVLSFTGKGTVQIKSGTGGGAVNLTGLINVSTTDQTGVPAIAWTPTPAGHLGGSQVGLPLNIHLGSGVTACEGYLDIYYDTEPPIIVA